MADKETLTEIELCKRSLSLLLDKYDNSVNRLEFEKIQHFYKMQAIVSEVHQQSGVEPGHRNWEAIVLEKGTTLKLKTAGTVFSSKNVTSLPHKYIVRDFYERDGKFLLMAFKLSSIAHNNLVRFVGYCMEGRSTLVYKMPNRYPMKSFDEVVHGANQPLDWPTRLKIATGVAKGLEYLELIADPKVCYRTFHPSGILLDANMNPYLCDFCDQILSPTEVDESFGYCDPEFTRWGVLGPKANVYYLGAVLIELITRRQLSWSLPLLREDYFRLADPELRHPLGLHKALDVAFLSLQTDAVHRPSIKDMVTALTHLANQAVRYTSESFETALQDMGIGQAAGDTEDSFGSSLQKERSNNLAAVGNTEKSFGAAHKKGQATVHTEDSYGASVKEERSATLQQSQDQGGRQEKKS